MTRLGRSCPGPYAGCPRPPASGSRRPPWAPPRPLSGCGDGSSGGCRCRWDTDRTGRWRWAGRRLGLTTAAGESVVLDTAHVIAATGFSPDLRRPTFLDAGLRAAPETAGDSRTPELEAGSGSSWPGLFFAGLLTAPSFGPSMRFVHGAGSTAGRLVKGVLGRLGARGPLPGSSGGARPDRAPAGYPETYLR